MNSAGATQFCPVCREANVLAIYSFVNPIDEAAPDPAQEVRVVAGAKAELSVTPIAPRSHELTVSWFVKPLAGDPAAPAAGGKREDPEDAWWKKMNRGMSSGLGMGGPRSIEKREAYAEPPPGEPSALGREVKGKPVRHAFPPGALAPGRYLVTAEVRDGTEWVLKDERHLLVERVSWTVAVTAE